MTTRRESSSCLLLTAAWVQLPDKKLYVMWHTIALGNDLGVIQTQKKQGWVQLGLWLHEEPPSFHYNNKNPNASHQEIHTELTHAVFRITISLMRTVYSALWEKLLKCICSWIHCATWSFNKPNQIIFSPSHITLFMNKVLRFWARLYFHESGINK